MAFETVNDILDFLKTFHRDLAALLTRLSDQVSEAKKEILLNFIGRHQKHLEHCLTEYEAEAAADLLKTWLKFVPEVPECRCFERVSWTPDMSFADIVEQARKVDDCLLKFYTQLAETAPLPEIRDLFQELLKMEQSENVKTLADALSFFEQN